MNEILRQALELYHMDAVFYNKVNRAVALATDRQQRLHGTTVKLGPRELNAMKTAAAVALVLERGEAVTPVNQPQPSFTGFFTSSFKTGDHRYECGCPEGCAFPGPHCIPPRR